MTDSLPSLEIIDSANCIKYIILTVSDKTCAATSENNIGIALQKLIQQHQGTVVFYSVINLPSEDIVTIEKKLRSVIEQNLADIILTIGGPGIAFKDTIPETYCTVLDLRKPGLNNGWVLASLEETTFDKLPRAVCGISNRILLNGLPGNQSSAVCGLSKCNKALIISLPADEEVAIGCYEALAPAASFASVFLKEDIPTKTKGFQTKEQDQTAMKDCNFKSKVSKTSEEEQDSQIGMVEVGDALWVLEKVVSLNMKKQVETCLLREALGRVLAQSICLNTDSNIQICVHDGYAIGGDLSCYPHNLYIDGHIKPGDDVSELTVTCRDNYQFGYKVSAGAEVPKNADRVILASDVKDKQQSTQYPGKHFFRSFNRQSPGFGITCKKEEVTWKKGYYLKSVDVGNIALLGLTQVSLFKKPVIAILTEGKKDDSGEKGASEAKKEVTENEPNMIIVSSILKNNGFKVINTGFCADEPSSLLEKLSYALGQADVVILQAETKEELKFAKPVLQSDLGALIHFNCIDMIPRNCTTFASLNWEGVTKLVFVMPGDPYTACLSTILFVLPTLRLLEGVEDYSNEKITVKIKCEKGQSIERAKTTKFLCAHLSNDDALLQVKYKDINLSTSSKFILSTMSSKSVLLRIPAVSDSKSSANFETVSVIPLNNYL